MSFAVYAATKGTVAASSPPVANSHRFPEPDFRRTRSPVAMAHPMPRTGWGIHSGSPISQSRAYDAASNELRSISALPPHKQQQPEDSKARKCCRDRSHLQMCPPAGPVAAPGVYASRRTSLPEADAAPYVQPRETHVET